MDAANRPAMSDLSPLLDVLERDGYTITDGLIDRPPF